MPHGEGIAEVTAPTSTGRSRARIALGAVLGAVLIGAAVWTVARQPHLLADGFDAARDAPPWLILLAIVLPVLNLALTSMVFSVLTNRFGRVPMADMAMLIGSGWLLNTLPMRPGMLGRIAYHRVFHGIPVRVSIRVLITSMALAVIALALLVITTVLASRLSLSGSATVVLIAAPAAVLFGLGLLLAQLSDRPHSWRTPTALGLRYLDMVAWAGRYAIVFAIIGNPLSTLSAAAVAVSGQAAMLSPVQLGLREWVVGLTSSLTPEFATTAAALSPEAMSPGLLADLVNRAAELAVLGPLGGIASFVLYTRWARRREPFRPPAL